MLPRFGKIERMGSHRRINSTFRTRGDRRPSRRCENNREFSAWVQAIAAVIAGVSATWTATVAHDSLREQQRLNRSQIELNRVQMSANQLTRDRFEARFAANVTWWADSQDGGLILIQNRSPILLNNVQLIEHAHYPDGATPGKYLFDIPPCSTAAARLGDYSPGEFHLLLTHFYSLAFSDSASQWERSSDGLRRVAYEPAPATWGRLPFESVQPTGNCDAT